MGIDNKYIVFKRDEWEAIASDKGTATRNEFLRVALPDAVVIRRQDAFAPPALDAYASAILVSVEGMRAMVGIAGTDEQEAVLNRLTSIADYFHEQAMEAWETHRKLPD